VTRREELDARGRRLRAALAAVIVRDRARELDLVHQWLDSWSGIGLIFVGMAHQGFTVSLGEHGVGRWIAVFFRGWRPRADRPGGKGAGADAVAGGAEGGVNNAQEAALFQRIPSSFTAQLLSDWG
jgi:hypothetical protein